ncbi:hypothetical protein [Microbacterium sp. NPDC076911]|uniref:hypothetical protein n=1 Tax=Microbacterium sp. NPDC076911 TaxID=3154958 RepID=UPI00341F8B2A
MIATSPFGSSAQVDASAPPRSRPLSDVHRDRPAFAAPTDVHTSHVLARMLTDRDLVFAISHTGSTIETLAAARAAVLSNSAGGLRLYVDAILTQFNPEG